MTVDLSKYVGQEVIVILVDDTYFRGKVSFNGGKYFDYTVGGWWFSEDGKGWSRPSIRSIEPIKSYMKGIAQRYPNINLKDFGGQKVFIKCKNGSELLAKVTESLVPDEWIVSDYSGCNLIYDIHEIYGEGAYEIKTKEIFDEPVDSAVEKAKEAIKDLTEEQIAKLLHSLKNKNDEETI